MNSLFNIKLLRTVCILTVLLFIVGNTVLEAGTIIPITVENNIAGTPQVFGVPIPIGELFSPDHVRVLNSRGEEIPSQITKVSTWEPADNSIKWLWVFFFTEDNDTYSIEYGEDIRNGRLYSETITVKNNQRTNGEVEVNTGPLRFTIEKGQGGGFFNSPAGSGFLDKVELDIDGDGFDEEDVIATGTSGRASFLDLLDNTGIDPSTAVVLRTVKEKGTGPLHAIIRVEGEYRYSREDNNTAPFVTRVHAYAGKSYIKVQHTFTYTGEPDMHKKLPGEYEAIATENGQIIDEEQLAKDPGFMIPNDRISSTGITLKYNLSQNKTVTSAYYDGKWYAPGDRTLISTDISNESFYSLLQTGPNPSQIPPLKNSSATDRLERVFEAKISSGKNTNIDFERAPGWIDISDNKWGISIGFQSFFEEYPKELAINNNENELTAYIWSPSVEPMSFARKDNENDSGMIGNFAQGLAKTTEMVFNFHKKSSVDALETDIQRFISSPVTHASPNWYAKSEAFGKMAESLEQFSTFERGINYKFSWMMYNQQWEPWYGMLNYGDFLTYYYNEEWFQWTNNEPAIDYMWWLQFVRTGNPEYYKVARAASMHTMDVDNIHWPKDPVYIGDTNESIHAFQHVEKPKGSSYVGMGRRHAAQHYSSLLSAHVWVAGWISSYYLDANHRSLEVAMQTGDYYVKRVFGEHGLTGRRLYLSIWNLAEIYDATKMEVYKMELDDRVNMMMKFQYHPDQGNSIVINRYGYAQVYVSNGLRRYYQLTGNEKVKHSVIDHAIRLRDVPPLNHDMESYLSSISSLVLGYEFSGEHSLLEEAIHRAQYLKTDALPQDLFSYSNQQQLANALEEASHLPKTETGFRPANWKITNGLRIFGWTSIYNIPYLEYWMEKEGYSVEK
jgi:hypothetical protein